MYALPYLLLQRIRQAAINARRRDRTGRYLAWSVLAGLAHAVMLVLGTAFVVFVPRGYHRLAYHAALYSRPGADPPAYALCAAAWASTSGTAIAWVSAK